MQRLGMAVLGVLFALLLLVVGVGLYSPVTEAITANAADARIQGLVNQLGDSQLTPARHLAQQHLEEAGPAAVDPLIAALHSSDSTLRRNSAVMLGFITSPRALDALSGVMATDPAPAVRNRAAWALGELNDIHVIAPLQHAAVLDPDPQVRQEAEYSLTAEQARLAVAAGKNDTQVSTFALAPSAPEVVYLAEMNQLAISRDGGKTWNTQTGKTSSRIVALAVSPTNSNVVYAGTESLGLYKGTDGGTTWVAMNQGLVQQPGERRSVTALAIHPQDPERVHAALGTWVGTSHASLLPRGIMQSLDQGQTWKSVDLGTNQVISRLVIVNHTLYALSAERIVLPPLQIGVPVSTLHDDNSEVSADGPTCAGSNCR